MRPAAAFLAPAVPTWGRLMRCRASGGVDAAARRLWSGSAICEHRAAIAGGAHARGGALRQRRSFFAGSTFARTSRVAPAAASGERRAHTSPRAEDKAPPPPAPKPSIKSKIFRTTPGSKAERPIYMDYQATTPMDPRVLEAMTPYFLERFGNPSSQSHVHGWEAQFAVEKARAILRDAINAEDESEIVFTSGATESNNLAIKGLVESYYEAGKKGHIVTVATEHSAVLGPCQYLQGMGLEITYLPVGPDGRIDIEGLRAAIRDDTLLVSVMAANNEIGILQDLKAVGRLVAERDECFFHTDAVQALGKVPLDVREAGVHLLSISGHKLYGPKGVGALYVRKKGPRARLAPQLHGGGQELGRRSGTLPVPQIVGLGRAVEIAVEELRAGEEPARLRAMRGELWAALRALGGVHLNGSEEAALSLPGCLNVSVEGVEGAALLRALRPAVSLSSGSACTSAGEGPPRPSHVLRALGRSDALAAASLRFGFGRFSSGEDVARAAALAADAIRAARAPAP
eukprot:tig00000093_g3676.t1